MSQSWHKMLHHPSLESGGVDSVDSRSGNWKKSRYRSGSSFSGGTPREVSREPQSHGWVPVALDEFGKPLFNKGLHDVLPSSILDDRNVVTELTQDVAGQLNNMYAFMNQAMLHERNRHSSDISLVLRKIEKDLRHVFRNVSETFRTLLDQMLLLKKEVDSLKEQVQDAEHKREKSQQVAEEQSKYALELEAVLDGHQPGVSQQFRQLSNDARKAKAALERQEEQAAEKEEKLRAEITRLESKLLTYIPPPRLEEAPSTWTLQAGSGDPGGNSTGMTDISTVRVSCDSQKLRAKKAKAPPPKRNFANPLPDIARPQSRPGPGPEKQAQECRELEWRCARLHRFACKAYPPLLLLSDVFAELRRSGCFGVVSVAQDGLDVSGPKDEDHARRVLGQLARLFSASAPQLRGLSELVLALGKVSARPPDLPQGSLQVGLTPRVSTSPSAGPYLDGGKSTISWPDAWSLASDEFGLTINPVHLEADAENEQMEPK
eukprot:TRINITY_DN91564_c0_g1_i1.p1 TRINITY_DN91564_c0_g1~~TRINITY_DN91564_c0_g1_i1.p1  ORF type:complete len:490 (-),score=105.08 TRINITY_DN91564_c0_g1_i1:2-1471(-)